MAKRQPPTPDVSDLPGPDWCPPHPIACGPALGLITDRDPIAPWSRLPGETDGGWAYFLHFRNMAYPDGPLGRFQAREIRAMAEALDVNPGSLYPYVNAFLWHERAGAYDRAIDSAKVASDQSEVMRVRGRHTRLLEKARHYAESELDKLTRRASNPDTPTASPREVKDLLEFVIKTERLLTGDVTDRIGVEGGSWDLEELSLEELELLQSLRKKAQAKSLAEANAIDTAGE